MPPASRSPRTVALVTLGCARNEVDSEELAARLGAGGWTVAEADSAENAATADVIVVNTCGFVDVAKKDSIDTLLAASDSGKKVVAVGCLAERYGRELADSLPEVDAVLGFDSYADLSSLLDRIADGAPVSAHQPLDRRTLLPISPVRRAAAAVEVAVPGHGWAPTARTRLSAGPVAYLKLASGCDRRCSFCAIPSFRGSFVSRPPQELLDEARWLASTGVRELVLVSENSTSYGKDLGDLRALERLLPQLAAIEGVERVRVSYLQPAELRPSLIEAIATTPGVAPYFDLSFQHASSAVLRRMRRFGSTDSFLALLAQARQLCPDAGARSNVIVGFPGETEADVVELERFLTEAGLDAIGVFGYSDEDGTEAATLPDKLPAEVVADRVRRISELADELVDQRAEDRIGSTVRVLVDQDESVGRAAHQGPEVDGATQLIGADVAVGRFVDAEVVGADGVDLLARPTSVGPGSVGTPS